MTSVLRFERAPRRVYWEVTRACGSRARALPATADPLAEDPFCRYERAARVR